MKHLIKFNDYNLITEKSIGSEAIRLKWYPDMEKRTFYNVINLDPTSVRKEGFSKPGKFSKWLLMLQKNGDFDFNTVSKKRKDTITVGLFVLTTGFFKNKYGTDFEATNELNMFSNVNGMRARNIFNFKSLFDFLSYINPIREEWERMTEKGKMDVICENEDLIVLIPLNFTACYEYSKNTEWCSQYKSGYDMWSRDSLLYRFIPKNNPEQKVRLTWYKTQEDGWNWASATYPEYNNHSLLKDNPLCSPFNFEAFDQKSVAKKLAKKPNFKPIKDVWDMLTIEMRKECESYYINKIK